MQPPPPDLGRALKEAGAQRKAEQNALRNVRKELDQLAAQDSQQRKLSRMMMIVVTASVTCSSAVRFAYPAVTSLSQTSA